MADPLSSVLALRCADLSADIAAWRAESREGGSLEKHYSGLKALEERIGPAIATVEQAAQPTGADIAALLTDMAKLERIWDVFRGPLMQRQQPRYAKSLRLADYFAWHCYRPAAARAEVPERLARDHEPPLVFAESIFAPVALLRNQSFAAQLVGDQAGQKAIEARFGALLRRLPVPLLGLPWGSLGHLPDMLLLAHEVGHVADADFGVQAALRGPGAPESLRQELAAAGSKWPGRMVEAVADVYGALAIGLPFLVVLEGLLGPWLRAEAAGNPPGRGYPPARLRLRMAARAVAAQPDAWPSAEFPPQTRAAVEATDAEAKRSDVIADGILGTRIPVLKDSTLLEAFLAPPFVEIEQRQMLPPKDLRQAAVRDRDRLRNGAAPQGISGNPADRREDIRALLGAAALVFAADPLAYAQQNVEDLVLARARQLEPVGQLGQGDSDAVVGESFDLLAELRGLPDEGL